MTEPNPETRPDAAAEDVSAGGGRPRNDARKVRLSVSLTPDLIEYLDGLTAADRELTRSRVVRDIVSAHRRARQQAQAAGLDLGRGTGPLTT